MLLYVCVCVSFECFVACIEITAESLGAFLCVRIHLKTVKTGVLALQVDERSYGTHKNKLKSSFPCTCDRITAV